MLVEIKDRYPYKYIDGMYSVSAEIRNKKRVKKAKFRKIMSKVLIVGGVIGITAIMHAYSVWQNGYDGIGGEAMIPAFAIIMYLVYKQLQRDEKNRVERLKWLEARRKEIAIREFREYDNLKRVVNERKW